MNVAKRTFSNTSGTYRSTRRNIMAAFDKLPREVRDALNSADFRLLLNVCKRCSDVAHRSEMSRRQ